MPLQAILFDREKLNLHDNFNEPLKTLLLSLHNYNVHVIDITSVSEGKGITGYGAEVQGQRDDTAPDSRIAVLLEERGLSFSDCLMLADCEETVQQAKAWNVAILGFQPSTSLNFQPAKQPKECPVTNQPDKPEAAITTHLDMIVEGFEEIDFYFLERIYQRHHHLPWTVIETERCILREITLEDLDALYTVYEPEEITRYLDGLYQERQKEEEYTKAYIENMYRFFGYGLWVVIEKDTGELIGRAGLEHLEMEEEVCLQLGYVIALHKQGQGIATEICKGIIDYAKEALEAEKLYCLIQEGNVASIGLAEKLQFSYEKIIEYNGKQMLGYVRKLQ